MFPAESIHDAGGAVHAPEQIADIRFLALASESSADESLATGSSCRRWSVSMMVISVARVMSPFSDWDPKQTFLAITSGRSLLAARLFSASTSGWSVHYEIVVFG